MPESIPAGLSVFVLGVGAGFVRAADANDYSLVFLPLAALAVWDRRDPLMVHVALGLLLLWWQPLALPIDARLLFVIKFLGLGAVGACLVRRASQQEVPNVVPECHTSICVQAEPSDVQGRKIMICIPIFNDWQSAGLLLEHIDRVVEQQQWTARCCSWTTDRAIAQPTRILPMAGS